MKILFTLAFILGSTVVGTGLLDLFLSKEQKKSISDRLEDIWLKLDDAGLQVVVQSPLVLLEAFYNFIFGPDIFSRKAYTRAAGIGVWLIIMLLSVDGIVASQPFGFKQYPWETLGNKAPKIDQTIEELKKIPDNKIDASILEKYQMSVDFTSWITSFDSVVAKFSYTIIVIIWILFFGSMHFYISICISRLMLQEAMKSSNVLTIFGVISLDIPFVIMLAWSLYITLIIICYPQSIPLVVILSMLMLKSPMILIFLMPFMSLILTITMPGWLGDVILVTVSPAAILFASALMGLILFPISKPLYRLMNNLILRSLEHEKGAIYAIGVILGSISTVIGLITHFLSH